VGANAPELKEAITEAPKKDQVEKGNASKDDKRNLVQKGKASKDDIIMAVQGG
jgi:hypothetical protein